MSLGQSVVGAFGVMYDDGDSEERLGTDPTAYDNRPRGRQPLPRPRLQRRRAEIPGCPGSPEAIVVHAGVLVARPRDQIPSVWVVPD